SSCTGLDPGIRLKRCRSSAECHVPTVRPRLMLDMFVVLGKFRPSLHFSSCHPETICLFFVSWRLLPSVASSCQEWIFLKYQEVTNNKNIWKGPERTHHVIPVILVKAVSCARRTGQQ
ncbi:mCG145584, isoform CRA_a, partial [Mus musculus]